VDKNPPHPRIMTAHDTDSIFRGYPPKLLPNYIGGSFLESTSSTRTLPVTNPFDGSTLTHVTLSTARDVDTAVQIAQAAFTEWRALNVKTRILKLIKLHQLMTEHVDELAEMVVKEHGKNIVEAKASVAKGMETLEVRCPFLGASGA
jgi:malonate-semialdehyde dehydrogenase (acetylating) / methylmalonate-semialdehyde dehydrogenase